MIGLNLQGSPAAKCDNATKSDKEKGAYLDEVSQIIYY